MTSFELWGPWTGSALSPTPRRQWLKHRTIVRFIMLAIVAAVAGYVTLAWISTQPVQKESTTRICGFNGGRCE